MAHPGQASSLDHVSLNPLEDPAPVPRQSVRTATGPSVALKGVAVALEEVAGPVVEAVALAMEVEALSLTALAEECVEVCKGIRNIRDPRSLFEAATVNKCATHLENAKQFV